MHNEAAPPPSNFLPIKPGHHRNRLSLSLFSILPPDYTHARSSSSSSDPFVVGPRGGGEEQTELLMDAPAAPPWRDTINLLAQISLFVYVGNVLFCGGGMQIRRRASSKQKSVGVSFPPFPFLSLLSSSYVSWFHTHVLESVHTESAKNTHTRENVCAFAIFDALEKRRRGLPKKRSPYGTKKSKSDPPPSSFSLQNRSWRRVGGKGYIVLSLFYIPFSAFSLGKGGGGGGHCKWTWR